MSDRVRNLEQAATEGEYLAGGMNGKVIGVEPYFSTPIAEIIERELGGQWLTASRKFLSGLQDASPWTCESSQSDSDVTSAVLPLAAHPFFSGGMSGLELEEVNDCAFAQLCDDAERLIETTRLGLKVMRGECGVIPRVV